MATTTPVSRLPWATPVIPKVAERLRTMSYLPNPWKSRFFQFAHWSGESEWTMRWRLGRPRVCIYLMHMKGWFLFKTWGSGTTDPTWALVVNESERGRTNCADERMDESEYMTRQLTLLSLTLWIGTMYLRLQIFLEWHAQFDRMITHRYPTHLILIMILTLKHCFASNLLLPTH